MCQVLRTKMGASQKRGANPGCEEGCRMNQVRPRGEGVFTGKTGHTKIGICMHSLSENLNPLDEL